MILEAVSKTLFCRGGFKSPMAGLEAAKGFSA